MQLPRLAGSRKSGGRVKAGASGCCSGNSRCHDAVKEGASGREVAAVACALLDPDSLNSKRERAGSCYVSSNVSSDNVEAIRQQETVLCCHRENHISSGRCNNRLMMVCKC
jgi:hypothetical protein